jgi:glycosyltransferase involved in cell wall biosynthesis
MSFNPAKRRAMTQETSPQITLCIPVLNEEKALPDLLKNISSYFGKFLIPYEVVICLDPSSDKSAEILEKESSSQIRVIKNSKHLGRAESLRQALLAANAPYIAATSVDLSTPLGDITKLLQQISEGGEKIAFGTRTNKKDSPFLSLNTKKNRLEITHMNIYWERNIRKFQDPFSTVFVMKKEIKDQVLNGFVAKGWYLTPQVQEQVLKNNIPYAEVPVHSTAGHAPSFPYVREYLRLFFASFRH